ncbi:MAG: hypothetical protein KBD65_02965 [Candidatus Moranbacteria bacterium]|nr:hypothetical protein [Candidatus Moranbacteria bacterium]
MDKVKYVGNLSSWVYSSDGKGGNGQDNFLEVDFFDQGCEVMVYDGKRALIQFFGQMEEDEFINFCQKVIETQKQKEVSNILAEMQNNKEYSNDTRKEIYKRIIKLLEEYI